jgi:hypothetical protein
VDGPRFLTQKCLITVYRLPIKENNIPFPFAANKRIAKTASNVLGQISDVFQIMTK